MMCTIGETLPQDRALEVARFGDDPNGAQYYRVSSDLVPGEQACKLRRDAFPTAGPVDLTDQAPPPVARSLPAPPPPPPEPMILPQSLPTLTVFYVRDYANLDLSPYEPELRASLEGVANVTSITIRAYSDSRGSEAENLEATQRYADAIKAWYVAAGVDADIIIAEGYGESELAIESDDDVDQPLNRFVEIEVLTGR